MIIDCKKIKEEIITELKNKDLSNITGAFIQVGNNPASNIYVKKKCDLCEELGIVPLYIKLDENTSENRLLEIIHDFNMNNNITGMLVQLPLPKHISEERVINAIDPRKDIDGFTNVNKGKLMIGDKTGFVSCTPKGIMTILEHEKVDIEGKNVVIVGRSNIVGRPLAQLLINKGATVTVCNSKTDRDTLKQHIVNSDIFISAIGKANYFDEEFFSTGVWCKEDFENIVAIDVGMNRDENNKLCGDISKDIYNWFKAITPVPGGVGAMTVVEVIRNLIKCEENKYES